MNDAMKAQLAKQDETRSTLARLQSTAADLRDQIAAVTDLPGVATACTAVWTQLQNVDLFEHDLLIDEQWNPDARGADPIEAIREYIAGAQAQVKGVMSDEYEIEVAKKRLTMAVALGDSILSLLAGYVEQQSRDQQAQLQAAQNRDVRGW